MNMVLFIIIQNKYKIYGNDGIFHQNFDEKQTKM